MIGNTLTADELRDLPASGNLLSLIDATAADVITDRVDTGGLFVGTAPRMGGHASSWTQTRFFLDGADITDPDGSGTPLLVPGVLEWDRVDVRTGAMPVDLNAAGLAISLTPRRPTAEWARRVDLFGAPPAFVSDPFLTTAPTISRLDQYGNVSFLASGPIIPNRLGIVVAGSWMGSTRFDRADPTPLDSQQASFFSHLVFTPDGDDELRIVAWGQHAVVPYENRLAFSQPMAAETDSAVHAQATWERKIAGGRLASVSGSYSIRQRSNDLLPTASIHIDSVFDPPIAALMYPGVGSDASWSAAVRLKPAEGQRLDATEAISSQLRRGLTAGAEASGGRAEMQPAFNGLIGESVDGLPARVWSITSSGVPSHWSETTFAAYAGDAFALAPRLGVEVGARFESVNASADGASGQISWQSFLPRASLRWQMLDWKQISFFAAYSRNAWDLPLTALAWGDPNAYSGTVYRWNTANGTHAPTAAEIGAPIQQIGPGAPAISAIDPALQRPYQDEATFGFEGHANAATLVRISAIARRERNLLAVVDTGVPQSAYSVSFVNDPYVDLATTADDRPLAIYSRPANAFGADRYLLTNPADDEATLVGVDVRIESRTGQLFYLLEGTASRAEALAGDRGFAATENDQGVIGDLYIDPNSRTYAQGRTFTERGYTIKTAGTYHFPYGVRLGVAARYQDGQHFARLVIAPDPTQGAEAVRAFRNGLTRFTYTMTVDARLQKEFAVNRYRIAAILDAYNLFNQHTEIEEFPVTGPLSRSTTAIQPPRALHAGIRVTF